MKLYPEHRSNTRLYHDGPSYSKWDRFMAFWALTLGGELQIVMRANEHSEEGSECAA